MRPQATEAIGLFLLAVAVAMSVPGCDSAPEEVNDEEAIEAPSNDEEAEDEEDPTQAQADLDEGEDDADAQELAREWIAEGTYFASENMDRDVEEFDGCMGVEVDAAGDVEFSLYLQGANFHSCTVIGTAERDGDRFLYRSESAEDCELEIAPTDEGLHVDEKGDGMPCSDWYCGARMAIGEESFDDDHRIDEVQECSAKAP